jgi:hypothetical protein
MSALHSERISALPIGDLSMKPPRFASVILALALMSTFAHAQTPTDIPVLQGLSPVNALGKSNAGQSALGANYALTGGIERGEVAQPTLLPFVEQEGQALQDAFIASKNLANLADGLGTTLGLMLLGCITSIKITLLPYPKP